MLRTLITSLALAGGIGWGAGMLAATSLSSTQSTDPSNSAEITLVCLPSAHGTACCDIVAGADRSLLDAAGELPGGG